MNESQHPGCPIRTPRLESEGLAGDWSLSCALKATLRSGSKALHKPAQGKRGTSAALGVVEKRGNAPKGLRMGSRPFRALFIFFMDPRVASASDAALPWAGLCRAFGPQFHPGQSARNYADFKARHRPPGGAGG